MILRSVLLILIITQASFSYAQNNNQTLYKKTFLEHRDHASDKWENYLDIYQDYLARYIGKNPNIIEIGVQNGGHLQILSKMIPDAKIYGIDILDSVCKMDLGKNIKTFCFNATKEDLIEENLKNIDFDVVIDDGSHRSEDVIATFEVMFNKVKPGGLYIIEDMHTSYWKNHNGGYKSPHSYIEYLKNLVDLLHVYHVRLDNDEGSDNKAFYNKLTENEKELSRWINSIEFYDSVAVIKKNREPKIKPYARVVVGTKQPIVPTIDISKREGYYHEPKARLKTKQ